VAKSKLEKALGLASSSYIGVSVATNFPDNDNRSSLKIYIGGKWGVCDLCACVCVYISIFVNGNQRELLVPATSRPLSAAP